jgi:stage II sporulation protein D
MALGLLAGLVAVAGCLMAPSSSRTTADPAVRVRLLAGVDRVELAIDGKPFILTAEKVRVTQTYGSSGGQPITIAGNRFHGNVVLVPVEAGKTFDVVNQLSIDQYLQGVVPKEAFPSWPAETLKAQAVASRTYALYVVQSRKDGGPHYDVHADVRSQAYGGVDRETPQTNQAVQQTRGIVLASGPKGREKIFCAYFSSTCGGITASGADVFEDDTPALRAHSSDGCADSPRYRWPVVELKKDELTRRIRLWGERQKMSIARMAKLKSIDVTDRNELGRPVQFAVTDVAGKRFTLRAEQMRNAMNAGGPEKPQVLSSFFTPVDAGDSIKLTEGRGWGHGVGLCQYCTAGWAERGMKAKQILQASYPGAALVRAY